MKMNGPRHDPCGTPDKAEKVLKVAAANLTTSVW